MSIEFFIPGPPKGKGRHRTARTRAGFLRQYPDPATESYEAKVICLFRQAAPGVQPILGAVRLLVEAFFAVPQAWSRKRRAKLAEGPVYAPQYSDVDNLGKIIADSLNGSAWIDDRQVVILHVEKRFADVPGVRVVIEEMKE